MMEDHTKTIMFTTNNLQGTPTIQYQTQDQAMKQQNIKIEGQKDQQFPTFSYNLNKIQMLMPQGQHSTVNLAQLSDDNKTIQYITQPYFGNYALVNGAPMQMQMTNGVTGITMDGRQLVVNKPITANTISNISFKCDVCGAMFAHLTSLNQHKRSHNQDDNPNENITLIQQHQGMPTTMQTIISETGQNLGQIQIVATESLEPATSQSMHANEVTMIQTKQIEKQKCVTCGGHMNHNPKRKGPKLIRCENCIHSENVQNIRPTQIFVAPDGDIKFEIGEMDDQMLQIEGTQIQQQQPQTGRKRKQTVTQVQPQQTITATRVTKCKHCNGSGVVVVNANGQSSQVEVQVQKPQQMQQLVQIQHSPQQTHVIQNQQASPVQQQVIHVQQAQPVQQQQTVPVQQHSQPPTTQTQNEKPFQCNVCGGKFSRYSSLWSHKKLHTGEKNYKCETCGIAFAKAVYLKNHMRIHTGEKPYRCLTCGMQFSQSPHLKNHERTHSGEKPYVCEVCDKGFARHATLWNHRRIHTGEKPYKCKRCQSAFSQAAHLKNHEKVHSGLKPFKCDICSAAFSDRFALKRHRNIHEKYGQTAPLASANANNSNTEGDDLLVGKEEILDNDIEEEEETEEVEISLHE